MPEDGTLHVTFQDQHCGMVRPLEGLAYDFQYDDGWHSPISLSMPVDGEPITSDVARAFFGGLLPEGRARRHIAQSSGIDELDDIALLRMLGHECAGAIRVIPDGFADSRNREISWLDEAALHQLVADLRIPGGMDAVDRYSVSLAGAQLKRGVVIDGAPKAPRVGLPLDDALSTHIAKLAVAEFDGIVENEHAMQELAAAIGLRASRTTAPTLGGELVLCVERYDRYLDPRTGALERLHQEDMCQALGRLPSHKYERYDPDIGRAIGPTVLDMVQLLRRHAVPSVQQVDDLLRLVWFNIIIGNVDAHAKNYSLLYDASLDSFAIAPIYDAICVSAYHAHNDVDTRRSEEPLVMHVGGCIRFWQLTRDDVLRHARELSIQPSFLIRQLGRLVDRVEAHLDPVLDAVVVDPKLAHPVLEVVRTELRSRCAFLRGVLSSG